MAKKKNRKPPAAVPAGASPIVAADPAADILSVSLRLPGALATKGKTCAAYHGISLNGLLCVALGDYLRARGFD